MNIAANETKQRLGDTIDREDETVECPNNLLPEGEICPRCGGPRAPSGVDGGSWVHFPRKDIRPSNIVEQDAELRAEMIAELSSTAIGNIPTDPEEARFLRFLRTRSRISAEIDRIKLNSQAMLKDLERRLEAVDFVCMNDAKEYVARQLAGKKIKSLKTPFGRAGFRTLKGGISLEDPKALVIAAESRLEYIGLVIQRPPEPSKTAINEYFLKTGDVPPGCVPVDPSEKFYVD